ncbi:GntR family transcriptional regulator [Jiangella mangrovi]|uniref:DNA-binding GntR family transcriptional regulator n=1 Tax=Jiangella mangrovi TaxID=1524084 RepID=A0A7W9GLY7_9ACTN|nr:GntR family transcriptional regulator [Jiangella mangrovi]MBB5786127.1 DNA-binding GntR family transcriptional regulator [Jiangella mangrovi]
MPRKKTELAVDSRFHGVVAELASTFDSTGDAVYHVLRESIIRGALAPGEWLRQEAIAEAIGVSRVPVRSALIRLEAEGLLAMHGRRGAQVRMLSVARVNEICRLRVLLESHALKLSMARMTSARIERLRGLAGELDSGIGGAELNEVRDRFYRELYDHDHNPVLVETIEGFRGQVSRPWPNYRLPGATPDRYQDLVALVGDGDLAGADAWVYAHVEKVRGHLHAIAETEEQA